MNSRQAWEDPNLKIAKLIDVDRTSGKTARVTFTDNGEKVELEVTVRISNDKIIDFIELSRYGDTAFLDHHNRLVCWSGLSIWNGTLSPALPGVDVYE